MHLIPLTAMAYDIERLSAERMRRVDDANLLWTITKNIRSLECTSGKEGDLLHKPNE
jgi:hypothetical protein